MCISSTDQPEVSGGDSIEHITLWIWSPHCIVYQLDPVHIAVPPAPGRSSVGDGRWDWNSSLLIRPNNVILEEQGEKQSECCLQLLCEVNGLGIAFIVTRQVRVDSRSRGSVWRNDNIKTPCRSMRFMKI